MLRRLFISCLTLALPVAVLAAPEGALDVEKLDERPELIKAVAPVYPYNMRAAGLEGQVTLDFVVNTKGEVVDPHVVTSNNPWFERPAIDALLRWKMKPGKVAGKPVNSRVRQVITFHLEGGGKDLWSVKRQAKQDGLPPELRWKTPPEPVHTAFPVYPWEDLQARRRGRTRVSLVVGPTGEVEKTTVLEATTPAMGSAAQAAIETWRFKPAVREDGSPGYALLGLEHEFSLSGGDVPVTRGADEVLSLLKRNPDQIAALAQLDEAPKPLSRRPPVFPRALLAAGKSGQATIEFYIDRMGDTQLPRVVSASDPEFGVAAVQAVATWRFTVPRRQRKATPTRAEITIDFNLPAENAG